MAKVEMPYYYGFQADAEDWSTISRNALFGTALNRLPLVRTITRALEQLRGEGEYRHDRLRELYKANTELLKRVAALEQHANNPVGPAPVGPPERQGVTWEAAITAALESIKQLADAKAVEDPSRSEARRAPMEIDERRAPRLAARAMAAAFDERYEQIGGLEEGWHEVCLAAALRALAPSPTLWIIRGWILAVADALEEDH